MNKLLTKSVIEAVMALLLSSGCAIVHPPDQQEPDRMKFEFDSFQRISGSCLTVLKEHVAKEYRDEYFYKNTFKSREPRYLEAVFVKMNGASDDSVVIVKFDSLCAIKKSYRTKMSVSEQYK
jgi:hypothetical protein